MRWLSGRTVYSNPQIGEREGDGREGRETDWRIFSNRAKQHPLTVAQLEGFQRARQRIDQPSVGDAVTGVKREFQSSILLRGGRREDFAHPVGSNLKTVIVGNGRCVPYICAKDNNNQVLSQPSDLFEKRISSKGA